MTQRAVCKIKDFLMLFKASISVISCRKERLNKVEKVAICHPAVETK